jgi:hypothetical protein
MRTLVLASILTCAVAVSAFADQKDGEVLVVDRAGHAFALGTNMGFPTYGAGKATIMTTPQTQYLIGATPTSFQAVAAGANVQIDYHTDGANSVADRVIIRP